jgi:hypothetical protein
MSKERKVHSLFKTRLTTTSIMNKNLFSSVFEYILSHSGKDSVIKKISVSTRNGYNDYKSYWIDFRVNKATDKKVTNTKIGVCLTVDEFFKIYDQLVNKENFEWKSQSKFPRQLLGTQLYTGEYMLSLIKDSIANSFLFTDYDIIQIRNIEPLIKQSLVKTNPEKFGLYNGTQEKICASTQTETTDTLMGEDEVDANKHEAYKTLSMNLGFDAVEGKQKISTKIFE